MTTSIAAFLTADICSLPHWVVDNWWMSANHATQYIDEPICVIGLSAMLKSLGIEKPVEKGAEGFVTFTVPPWNNPGRCTSFPALEKTVDWRMKVRYDALTPFHTGFFSIGPVTRDRNSQGEYIRLQIPAMQFKHTLLTVAVVMLLQFFMPVSAGAQQYKLRQSTTTMGMKSESTIYVKGMRKRTEGGGYMGMSQPTTIEQCDSQRTIKINDKKKIYFIEPFAKDEEIIDEDNKKEKAKPAAAKAPVKTKDGGVITMTYNILDTGERKKVYGLTARRVWTTQKIKPSADACTMKDSMIIKTDGWYIDLPQFNCPVRYAPTTVQRPGGKHQPQCMDRFVTRRSGKGRLGFPIEETKTMIMGSGSASVSEFKTEIETLELSHAKLDSMLFEIPPGYKQVYDEEELQDKVDAKDMMKYAGEANRQAIKQKAAQTRSGGKKIGVLPPTGNEELNMTAIQEQLVVALNNSDALVVAVASEEEARKEKCELVISSEFSKFKQASKLGGVLKAIKNTDPFAGATFNIEASLTLKKLSDNSKQAVEKVSGKYEGKAEAAAGNALQEGCMELLQQLND